MSVDWQQLNELSADTGKRLQQNVFQETALAQVCVQQ